MSEGATPTRFGLIRHAETHWNREKRIQGQRNSPLTAEGQKDAEHWGQKLSRISWNRILGSDLGRVAETAAIINHYLQIPYTADPRLREQDWGEWTAEPIAKIQSEELPKLEEGQRSGWQFCPPAGEDRFSVWQRSHSALMDAANRWPGETILIVSHEGVIKSLIYRLSNYHFSAGEPTLIEPRCMHWLIVSHSELQIHRLNALQLA